VCGACAAHDAASVSSKSVVCGVFVVDQKACVCNSSYRRTCCIVCARGGGEGGGGGTRAVWLNMLWW